MNLPNKLTVSRLILTLIFIVVIFSEFSHAQTAALLLFSVASLTDYFDGRIARRDKLITNFGILMDPLADKILICSAFIAFVGLKLIPAWMVVVIVARELAITGLRLLAASKQVVLAAENYGKHKTISQIVAILAMLVYISYQQWGPPGDLIFGFSLFGNKPWVQDFAWLSTRFAVLLTFLSGSIYLWRNRGVYMQDM
jgi:CDP-diacylglycerol---glycerol-3-phosphate 3-phosphatidyltransferase